MAKGTASMETSGVAAATQPPSSSIAVLPFVDLSPKKDQDHFCEGMAEEIQSALAGIENLRVAARQSTFRFKGSTDDVRKIGEALGVGSVLEGSVRTASNRLRVVAKLVDVETGYQVWSEHFDRNLEDVFAIQDEIAGAVARALRLTFISSPVRVAATPWRNRSRPTTRSSSGPTCSPTAASTTARGIGNCWRGWV